MYAYRIYRIGPWAGHGIDHGQHSDEMMDASSEGDVSSSYLMSSEEISCSSSEETSGSSSEEGSQFGEEISSASEEINPPGEEISGSSSEETSGSSSEEGSQFGEEISSASEEISSASDSDSPEDSDSRTVIHPSVEQPLFPGSEISVFQSHLLIYQFYVKHSLTNQGCMDLLTLLKVHMPTSENLPTSLYSLKQFFSSLFPDLISSIHYYCSRCHCYLGVSFLP